MQKLMNKIIKYAKDNDYSIVVDDGGNPEVNIELIVIDNILQIVYIGQKKEYLSNPNMED